MKCFALDCSAAAASVAVLEDGFLLGEQFANTAETHSSTLLPMAQHLLETLHLGFSELDCFAVSCGPGSFTGLRIGIAAVKGMAFPRSTPCIPVSTLEGLAYNLLGFEGTIAAVMDARCRQVYAALFAAHEGRITRLTEDAALSIEELAGRLAAEEGPLWLAGDGAALVYQALREGNPALRLAPEAVRFQRASGVGTAALLHREAALAPAALLPSYLRPVHAATLAERQQKKE